MAEAEPLEFTTVVCPPCMMCGEQSIMYVPAKQYDAWKAGAYVQVAFSDMDADKREVLISGTHPECWPFTDDDED